MSFLISLSRHLPIHLEQVIPTTDNVILDEDIDWRCVKDTIRYAITEFSSRDRYLSKQKKGTQNIHYVDSFITFLSEINKSTFVSIIGATVLTARLLIKCSLFTSASLVNLVVTPALLINRFSPSPANTSVICDDISPKLEMFVTSVKFKKYLGTYYACRNYRRSFKTKKVNIFT